MQELLGEVQQLIRTLLKLIPYVEPIQKPTRPVMKKERTGQSLGGVEGKELCGGQ
jgi:hypothetical protein